MARAGADVREAELVQDLADRARVVGHAEALGDQLLEVDPAPAHDTMHGPIWTGLDELGQFGLLVRGEAGRVALGADVLQPLRAALVEAVNPVAQGLAVHAAEARRLAPAHPVQDGGEGQKATALVGVLRRGREPTKLMGREVRPHPHGGWHRAGPPYATESDQAKGGNPHESTRKAAGIRGW